MQLAPATRLGPYELLAPIGAGGMGEVWKGKDTRLGRIVAIKFSQEQFNERFEREARAVAALNHPNICQLYDIGPNYLVMEYVEGSPVAPVDAPRKLLDLAVQIADGMAAAHTAGFVHRDLKPDNILVTPENRIKILDFGLAKQAAQPKTSPKAPDDTRTIAITDPGTIVGTVAYMSPEQARGQEVDARSDQFSFGLILYEMASGKRAFPRESAAETMTAIIREDAEPLPANVPAPLRWIVERCLAKDPGDRYDSTRDLYRDLKQVREHLSETTMSAITAPMPLALPPPKRRWIVHTIWAVALVCILAAIALWPMAPSEPPRIVPFATEFELQTMPRWSPKGDRIAYIAPVDGILQVFTRALGSSTPTRITHEKESCLNPFWSADGTRIYFTTGFRPNTNLRSIAVAGGQSDMVIPSAYQADLSPDGKTLAALVPDAPGNYRLTFSSPPGAPPRPYSQAPLAGLRTSGINTSLRYNRSGKYLGFLNGTSFWKIPSGNAPPEEMLHETQNTVAMSFTWLGDGDRIIRDSIVGASNQLSIVDFSSQKRWNITAEASKDQNPALSPDGRTLAFDSGEAGYDIIEVPLDGSPARGVIATAGNELAPAWAPDGAHFAYATDRSGISEVWLRNRADGTERLIAGSRDFPETGAGIDCEVSPDGSRVAYRVGGRPPTIWISPVTGESPTRLWDDPAHSDQRGPSWSPDGNWIAYYGFHSSRPSVMKARVGANAPPEFLVYMGTGQPVRWSPRGDWIAFRDDPALRIISPDGKQNRIVSQRAWETYGWSKDGASIYGIADGENRRLILARIDVANARETTIADLGPVPAAFDLAGPLNEFPYRGFSLNPDGKSFLTSILRVKTQIYLMPDFDRPQRLVERLFQR
jgi:eukaryotic-like serine/threonine-protein kinase